ncbi:hypothetical protein MLD38_039369 [Melastoma candidum]|uniref:Uncharacterized protein n=1 Tax=Melastoma candidum TaxID=119954 RepID=A0ACB9L2M4_9MYRT|nr:hypothetical protein MLD38_039369 [Melastoma candidum]
MLQSLHKRLENFEKGRYPSYFRSDPDEEIAKLKRQIKILEDKQIDLNKRPDPASLINFGRPQVIPQSYGLSLNPISKPFDILDFENRTSSFMQIPSNAPPLYGHADKKGPAEIREVIREQQKSSKRRNEIREGKRKAESSRPAERHQTPSPETQSSPSPQTQLMIRGHQHPLDCPTRKWVTSTTLQSSPGLSDNTSDGYYDNHDPHTDPIGSYSSQAPPFMPSQILMANRYNESSTSESSSEETTSSSSESTTVITEQVSDVTSETSSLVLPHLFMADREETEASAYRQEEVQSDESMEETPPRRTEGSIKFTFDDIPREKWPERIQDFLAWCTHKRVTVYNTSDILTDLTSNFHGTLQTWWNLVSEQDQITMVNMTFTDFMNTLHLHLIGNPSDLLEEKRAEFFSRRCCSYKVKDLDKHFQRMLHLFLHLGGDNTYKPVFLSSIESPISAMVEKSLLSKNARIAQLTVGQIQQEIISGVNELCQRKEIIEGFLKQDRRLDQVCRAKKNRYKIKCTSKDLCSCAPGTKPHKAK